MSGTNMNARDLYLRHTDTNGRTCVRLHRVWDAELFISAREAEAQRANAEVKGDGDRKARVDIAERSDYLADRATN